MFRKSSRFLLVLVFMLFPFNSMPFFYPIFGEMAFEGAFYSLLAGLVLVGLRFFYVGMLNVPRTTSFYLLVAFGLWVLVSSAGNWLDVIYHENKGRSGLEKLTLQGLLVTVNIAFAFAVYQLVVQEGDVFKRIRRYVTYSVIPVVAYAVVELGYLAGSKAATGMLSEINGVIRGDESMYPGRLRAVSGEASWFGMYCSFTLPWLLSYLFDSRNLFRKLSFIFFFLFLVLMTFSRTAYVITVVQVLLFTGSLLFVRSQISSSRRMLLALSAMLGSIAIGFSNGLGGSTDGHGSMAVIGTLVDESNSSNVARYGSLSAALSIWRDNPILGVGIGQYGFHFSNYIPEWAAENQEILNWASTDSDTNWPPVHNIYARIAAETGVVGLLIWMVTWVVLLKNLLTRHLEQLRVGSPNALFGLTLCVSTIGVLLSGLNFDSFRFPGYWLVLGLAWVYLSQSMANQSKSWLN